MKILQVIFWECFWHHSVGENKDGMDYEMMTNGAVPVNHQYVNIDRRGKHCQQSPKPHNNPLAFLKTTTRIPRQGHLITGIGHYFIWSAIRAYSLPQQWWNTERMKGIWKTLEHVLSMKKEKTFFWKIGRHLFINTRLWGILSYPVGLVFRFARNVSHETTSWDRLNTN